MAGGAGQGLPRPGRRATGGNNIFYKHLLSLARPAGAADEDAIRSALATATR